jgi:hypothetical protein
MLTRAALHSLQQFGQISKSDETTKDQRQK